MKYRVRFDMSFATEASAMSLLEYGKSVLNSVSPGEGSEDNSYCSLELCRHDEGLPCTLLERAEATEI